MTPASLTIGPGISLIVGRINITTNTATRYAAPPTSVAFHAQQPANPLADFLDALRRVRDLDVDEVLPAHEWRFRGLDARVDQLLDHHRRRLDETYEAISSAPGLTCWETTLRLRWSRDWSQIVGFMRRAAVGETLAHLVLLESTGRVRHDEARPVHWYPAGNSDE